MTTSASEYAALLAEIQNSNITTYTTVPTTEPRFSINANTRAIEVPSEFTFLGVRNDHKAETIYFEIDRYFDDVDLSEHTCVIQFLNKNASETKEGVYPITTMDVDSVDGKIVFGWNICNDATQLSGDIVFSVRFYSIDENGLFTYNFNTLSASSIILETLNTIDSSEIITSSELEIWNAKMESMASIIESDIKTVEEKIEELENSIASIPEDYTALTNEVSQLSNESSKLKETLVYQFEGTSKYNHSQTVKADSSNYVNISIDKGAFCEFVNNSTNSNLTLNLIDESGNETFIGSVYMNCKLKFVTEKNIVKIRCYSDNTDFSFMLSKQSYQNVLNNMVQNKFLKYIQPILRQGVFSENSGHFVIEPKRCTSTPIFLKRNSTISIKTNGNAILLMRCETYENDIVGSTEVIFTWQYDDIDMFVDKDGYYYVLYATSTVYDACVNIIPCTVTAITNVYSIGEELDRLYNGDALPLYWLNHIAEKIDIINDNADLCAISGDTFMFFTDYHIENNAGYSHKIIESVMEQSNIGWCVFGGDIFNGEPTSESANKLMRTFFNRFRKINMFNLRGNHEYNRLDGGSYAEALSVKQQYSGLMKRQEENVNGVKGKFYYYKDNEFQKIRYIFLDTGFNIMGDRIETTQIDWMKARVSELGEDWTVVIFAHAYSMSATEYTPSGQLIHDAITELTTTANATIACIICGHAHTYVSGDTYNNGVAEICVECDCEPNQDNTYTPTFGTTDEHAIDVFSIDTTNKKIYAIRIGRGESREWSYGN